MDPDIPWSCTVDWERPFLAQSRDLASCCIRTVAHALFIAAGVTQTALPQCPPSGRL